MDIKEAEKLSKVKNELNYLTFYVDYNTRLVVPAKAGLLIMEALTEAEILDEGYDGIHGLKSMSTARKRYMACDALSVHDYRKMKMAQLLNIDYRDITDMINNKPLTHTPELTD